MKPGEVPPLPRNLTLVLKSDSRVRWMLKSSGIQVHAIGHRGDDSEGGDDVEGTDHCEYGGSSPLDSGGCRVLMMSLYWC